jgi:RNA polymerase sigma-70 factor (ECF subfamily)
MDDPIAISRLKQGDLSGLEHIVNRYQVQAVYAAYMIVYDQALAEDVAQTAFIKVAERIRQFDENRSFAPWFFRIVINDALKLVKRQKRNVSLDGNVGELAKWLADPSLHPEKLMEQEEMSQLILKAIQSLSPEQRAVVVMRYFLEMSEAEMSVRMERPFSTIKWWLREARKRLRQLINASQFEDGN